MVGDSDAVSHSTGQRRDFTVVDSVAGAGELNSALIFYGCCIEACGLVVLPDYQSVVGVTVSECLDVGWRTWCWRRSRGFWLESASIVQ